MHLASGQELPYDVLVVATGAVLAPEETEGLTGPGWKEKVFTFYTSRGPRPWPRSLTWFDGGRVVVNVVEMPIKCPVAPLEFCFLADWFFRAAGHARPGRADLRDSARRRVHQAGGLTAPRRDARASGASSS